MYDTEVEPPAATAGTFHVRVVPVNDVCAPGSIDPETGFEDFTNDHEGVLCSVSRHLGLFCGQGSRGVPPVVVTTFFRVTFVAVSLTFTWYVSVLEAPAAREGTSQVSVFPDRDASDGRLIEPATKPALLRTFERLSVTVCAGRVTRDVFLATTE